jgi:prepilin-type N-terminal cleavage/methylation domain-containing protein
VFKMRNKKGLTIIECLLSIIILAVMLTAGMAFYYSAQASMYGSIHKRIALEMASAELESIKNMPYDSVPDYATLTKWTNESQNITEGILAGLNGNQIVAVESLNGYKHVQVEIDWKDAGKSVAPGISPDTSSVSLDTYIAP